MLVLVYHSMGDLTRGLTHVYPSSPLYVWVTDGHTGVSAFLVLSGFILTVVCRDALTEEGSISYSGFIFNRFIRIFPLLLFVTAIAIATSIPSFKATDILPLLTLQLYASDSIGISSEWAVGVEFQAYLIFPVLLLMLKKEGVGKLFLFIGFMVVVRFMLSQTLVTHNGSYYSVLLGRIDQFVVGMIAAHFYLRFQQRKVPAIACVLAITGGLAGLTAILLYANSIGDQNMAMYARGQFFPAVFHLSEAILWASVLMGYILLPVRRIWLGSIWSRLGQISFSLYLLHPLVTSTVRATVYRYVFEYWDVNVYGDFLAPAIATIILVIPASVIVAMMSYEVIEKPALAFRRPYIDHVRSRMNAIRETA